MGPKRAIAASLILAMGIMLPGCEEKDLLDAKNSVTIEIWHYYNGIYLTAFDSLVKEFNEGGSLLW